MSTVIGGIIRPIGEGIIMVYNFIICNNMEEAISNESPWGNEDFEISADDIKALEDGKFLPQ